ncbi:MAG: 4Fe-4S ferredoxin [Chloroflexi bacterium]|nr:4Fe-4S ferredoxin [Chloroflexota bacterium]
MPNISAQLRETARDLLRDGQVEVVVGYERGSLPLRSSPCFVRDPAGADRLVWDASCENNLAVYLRALTQRAPSARIGVVAKGCDGRSIVGAIVERQIPRDSLYVIAVPCEGVLDRRKVGEAATGEVVGAAFDDEELVLTLQGADASEGSVRLPLSQVLYDACAACTERISPIHDTVLGERPPEVEAVDDWADVQAIEALDAAARWAHFAAEFSACIRCYACREACPLCYCSECVADQSQPAWFGRTDDISDTMSFHLTRALHLAGRCVDCGACSRACPMGIDLRLLNRKMAKEVLERYGYRAGLDLEAVPPLATFRPDDPQEFIL